MRSTRLLPLVLALLAVLAPVTAGAPSAAAAPRPWDLPFSDMTIVPAGAGRVVASAPGPDAPLSGDLLGLWRAGTASGPLDFGPLGGFLWVQARADPCEGPPVMELLVDGEVVHRQAVSSSTRQDVHVPGRVAPGVHQVGIRYVEDRRTAACDRNLKVTDLGAADGDGGHGGVLLRGDDLQPVDPRAGTGYRYGPHGLPGTVLWGATSAAATVDLQQGVDFLGVSATSRWCEGYAVLELRVDGTRVLRRTLGNGDVSWDWPWYGVRLPAPLPAGRHRVEVALVDPHHGPGCDRTLRLKAVWMSGPVRPGG